MKRKTNKRKFKLSWRRVLSFGLAIFLLCGVIAGIGALTKHLDDDMKTIHPTFKIGALDVEGIATSDKGALYTPEAFLADGLTINLDADSHLSYRVFFYTKEGEFVSSTNLYTKTSSPYYAPGYYARVVLYPIWDQLDDDDEKISWYEVWGYTSDVEIRVLKEGYKYEKVFLTDDFFKRTDVYTENPGYSTAYFEVSDSEIVIDSIYFDVASGATQELSEMGVNLKADGKNYVFDSAYSPTGDVGTHEGDLPTKDNPLYIPAGVSWTIFTFPDGINYDDLVVYVHRAPAN